MVQLFLSERSHKHVKTNKFDFVALGEANIIIDV